uniref:Uncharacterized protein n=1 Tax=Triticum urartu TaxID=4572 RepID=A0A8R7PM49_TRIUA
MEEGRQMAAGGGLKRRRRRRGRRRRLGRGSPGSGRALDWANRGAEPHGDRVAHAPVERRLAQAQRGGRLAVGAGRRGARRPQRRRRVVEERREEVRIRRRRAHHVPLVLPLELPQLRLVVPPAERGHRGRGARQGRQIRRREALEDGPLRGHRGRHQQRLLRPRPRARALPVAPGAAPAAVAAGAAEPGEDVAAGALAGHGGGEVGALVERHAALAPRPGQGRRDLLRGDADAVRHDRLQLPHAQRRLHGDRAQVHAPLAVHEHHLQHRAARASRRRRGRLHLAHRSEPLTTGLD